MGLARFAAGVIVGVVIAAAAAHAEGADAMTVNYRTAPPAGPEELVRDAALEHGVSPDWLLRIARCESGLNRYARNPSSGALGLFQLVSPGMRDEFGPWAASQGLVPDVFDPAQQAEFAATQVAHGRAGAWVCR